MGIFSSYAEMSGLTEGTHAFNEADLTEEMERLEEMAAATNLSDDPEEACIESMMIGQENFHNLVMNITNEEVQYMLENGGEEIVYEGARLDALIDKIQTLIDKAWQKIKSIFEKALAAINSWVSTDKRFVQKYGEKIKKSSDEARTIRDTYDIKVSALEGAAKLYESYANKLKGVMNITNKGANHGHTDKESIVKYILDGASNVQEQVTKTEESVGLDKKEAKLSPLDPAAILAELKDGKDNKKVIKLAYQNAKKAIASMKKQVQQAKSDALKADKSTDTKNYNIMISGINVILSAMSATQRVHIRACNVYHSNCRKAAARAVRGVQDVKEAMEIGGAYESDTEFAWLQ